MEFREAYIKFLSEEGISQAKIAENYSRAMSPQSLNAMLKSRGTSAIVKSELLDALFKLNKKRGGRILRALVSRDDEATKALFDYARKHYSLINETILFNRTEMDSLIERDMGNADNKLVIIGSISSKKLNKKWYEKVASILTKQKSLDMKLFIESNQALYWRANSLDADEDPEVRPYEDLIMKNEKLISEIKKQVQLKISNIPDPENIMKRLNIYEVDFPITANVISIDEYKTYVTPKTHLRSSRAATLFLSKDYPNTLWEQYNSYVKFFLNMEEKSGKFIGPKEPEDQKILLYSDNALIPRGVGRSSILDSEPKLITRVVHGLVFNYDGELLLRYRREERDKDNQNRWDKSCGSNVRPTDVSSKFSIKRTIRKELFEKMALDISDILQKSVYEESKILDLGEWRGAKGLKQCSNKKEWYFFELLKEENKFWAFPGPRYKGKSEIVVDFPNILASIFIIICNEEFFEYTKEIGENCPRNKVCRWIMPKRDMKIANDLIPQTNDLETYLYKGESSNSLFAKICQISLTIKTVFSRIEEKSS